MVFTEIAQRPAITQEMICQAYRAGVATLISCPLSKETVCQIGNDWFYFGGLEAEEYSPEIYRENVPEDTIVEEIYTALTDISTFNMDEYRYFSGILAENGIVDDLTICMEKLAKKAEETHALADQLYRMLEPAAQGNEDYIWDCVITPLMDMALDPADAITNLKKGKLIA